MLWPSLQVIEGLITITLNNVDERSTVCSGKETVRQSCVSIDNHLRLNDDRHTEHNSENGPIVESSFDSPSNTQFKGISKQ